jgi:hypothetical protein
MCGREQNQRQEVHNPKSSKELGYERPIDKRSTTLAVGEKKSSGSRPSSQMLFLPAQTRHFSVRSLSVESKEPLNPDLRDPAPIDWRTPSGREFFHSSSREKQKDTFSRGLYLPSFEITSSILICMTF